MSGTQLGLPVKVARKAEFSNTGGRMLQENAILYSEQRHIFSVADGFGGSAGKRAAEEAVRSLQAFLEKEARDEEATLPFVIRSYYSLAANVLFNAMIHANRVLLNQNRGKGVNERGGASLIGGFLDGNLLALGNLGSCSCSLSRAGKVRELVAPRDYSRLIDPIGGSDDSDPDIMYRRAPLTALGISKDLEPEIQEFRLSPGDWVLLNTGAVSRRVCEEILSFQQQPGGFEAALSYARSLGFFDNASFLLLEFTSAD